MLDLKHARAMEVCPSLNSGCHKHLRPPAPHPRMKIKIEGQCDFLVGRDSIAYTDIESVGTDNLIILGDNSKLLGSKIRIKGSGCRVIIGPHAQLKAARIVLAKDNCLVVIGGGTTWESGAFICDRGMAIVAGNDCMFSSNIVVRTSDGHGIWDKKTGRRLNLPADVSIGHHVWLGNGARVNKGAKIGSGSILGQCAIASGRLEDNCIYAGIPAKKVRESVHWTRDGDMDELPLELQNDIVDRNPDMLAPETDGRSGVIGGIVVAARRRVGDLFQR